MDSGGYEQTYQSSGVAAGLGEQAYSEVKSKSE